MGLEVIPVPKVFRNLCPRNCFSTCAILSHVENGKLVRVSGDPAHGFTRGNLCAKGYAYVERVYSSERVLHPLRQFPRGSGNWCSITWDEALEVIARKILELKGRYHSFLPVCLCKHYGNMGLLHYAVNALFDGLGSVTVTEGNSCWSAGLDAYLYSMGSMEKPDPEDMVNSKVIVLWGVNPAWTAVHQMHFIDRARTWGAQVVVIDPVFTSTAAQADFYLRPKAGSDGALALGMAKTIVENGWHDPEFLVQRVEGYEAFFAYLTSISYDWVEQETALPREAVKEVAELYALNSPAAIWTGLGLQRHTNGGQNVRAIIALAALTGNLGKSGAGLYNPSLALWDLFSYYTRDCVTSRHPVGHRKININLLGSELTETTDPPVKMLWLAQRDLWQDAHTGSLKSALEDLDLVVQVDQFLNRSSRYADIFLPTTTQFEEWDVVPSYWHHWIGINEPAISPLGESKSDLQIAWELSGKLNELSPGVCSFPTAGKEEEWLAGEFNQEINACLGIDDYRELLQGPRKLKWPQVAWEEIRFKTPSGKFEISSLTAAREGLPLLPVYSEPASAPAAYPFRLMTPHSQAGNNSQFLNLPWLTWGTGEPCLRINPLAAKRLGLHSGDLVRVYNQQGEILLPVKLSATIREDTLMCFQGWHGSGEHDLNDLVNGSPTDMGSKGTGRPATAIHDTFVNLCPA